MINWEMVVMGCGVDLFAVIFVYCTFLVVSGDGGARKRGGNNGASGGDDWWWYIFMVKKYELRSIGCLTCGSHPNRSMVKLHCKNT